MQFQTEPMPILQEPPQPKPQPLPGTIEEAVRIETVTDEDDMQSFERLKRLRP